MDTIIDPRPPPALTPIQAPTPIRPPTRRMVVKTQVSAEAQAEIAAAEKRLQEERDLIEGAPTLIGYPAPVMIPPPDFTLPPKRGISDVKTVIRRGIDPQVHIVTDPMRPAPPAPDDLTIRPNQELIPTLPPDNKIPPAQPPVGAATVPPGHNVALPPVTSNPLVDSTVLLGKNTPAMDIAFADTVPPGEKAPVPVMPIQLVDTVPPAKKVEPAKPPLDFVETTPPAAKVAPAPPLNKAEARAMDDVKPLPAVRRGPKKLLMALVCIAAVATGVGLGVLLKKVVGRSPVQSSVVEVKP